MACETSRNKKSGGHERRKKQTLTKKKKNDKKEKKSDTEKKMKKNRFGRRGPRPHSLPKSPCGLPFGPQVRPESGYSYHFRSPFNSYRKYLYHPTAKNDQKTGTTTGTTVLPW